MSTRPRAPRAITSAEIIAVGSELLTSSRMDTNSLFITDRLDEIGIRVEGKVIVGDDRANLAAVFREALARRDLVVLTGGLGPTDDDVTREVVAGTLGLSMTENPTIVARIRQRFDARGARMPEINRRQALVPETAVALDNPHGTAPGLWIERPGKVVLLLPGPPREMQPMLEALVAVRLAGCSSGHRVYRRRIVVAGRTESSVEEAAHPVYGRWQRGAEPVQTTILASLGQIELHLTTSAATVESAQERLDAITRELRDAIGPSVVSTDGKTLEQVVGDRLVERGFRIAVAESCTGGLVASRLTDVPGSSRYVELGVVTYTNHSKMDLLGVPAGVLEAHGAVSEAVAVAMAEGVKRRARVEVALGITGIAGPSGGTAEKPVGTVAIAVAAASRATVAKTFRFLGGRREVKRQASQAGLDLVRRCLEDAS